MSGHIYHKEGIKEFILCNLQSNQIVPDCLMIVYKNIIDNIISTYKNNEDIVRLKASYFELYVLYKYTDIYFNINMFFKNNYETGIIFVIDNYLISLKYNDTSLLVLLVDCCELGNIDIFKKLYEN